MRTCLRIISILFLLGFCLHTKAKEGTFCLFPKEIKSERPSYLYDFLERYLFELDSLSQKKVDIKQRIKDDGVCFLVGSPNTARKIKTDFPFSINRTENRFYQVTWMDVEGTPILDITFPVQFELILGKPKVQMEEMIFDHLKSQSTSYHSNSCEKVTLFNLEDGCFRQLDIKSYYVDSLNDAEYYIQNSDSIIPVFDNKYMNYSAANLMRGIIDSCDSYQLYIEQALYGFQSKTYLITLSQWLNYCRWLNLHVYFSIDEEREDGMTALLIAQSEELGFNHMMSLIIPYNFIDNQKSVLKARLNAFIPINNVKDLYQKYTEKPKKKI